jgi:riboflavin synthase alpha subunit
MPLNLERSLKMGEEIGGHLVSGHVHCMGKVKEFKKGKEKNSYNFETILS